MYDSQSNDKDQYQLDLDDDSVRTLICFASIETIVWYYSDGTFHTMSNGVDVIDCSHHMDDICLFLSDDFTYGDSKDWHDMSDSEDEDSVRETHFDFRNTGMTRCDNNINLQDDIDNLIGPGAVWAYCLIDNHNFPGKSSVASITVSNVASFGLLQNGTKLSPGKYSIQNVIFYNYFFYNVNFHTC